MKKIMLLTGPIRSGKTSRLSNWVINLGNVNGILAPVRNEKRYLLHIESGEEKLLEISDDKPNSIKIGRYCFDPDVFKWARTKLFEAVENIPDYLVVDEVGPLELKGEGLEPAVSNILQETAYLKNVIFVVRSNILNDFFFHYKIGSDEFEIINP